MISLFTDFGSEGPYAGQMRAVLAREAPGIPVVDLLSDAPPFRARGAGYLLAALAGEFPAGTVFLCVVDPGVGTGEREPIVLQVDGRWYVGPDNGLFDVVARRGGRARRWRIVWRPRRLSATFHGRDLFAPVAAAIAVSDEAPESMLVSEAVSGGSGPDDLAEIIYVDRYGNLMTGIRGDRLAPGRRLAAGGIQFGPARTFGEVGPGTRLWYVNSIGLAELAVNRGSAASRCGLGVGTAVEVVA